MSTRYVDQYGLEHYHGLIKTEIITATHSEATYNWTGTIDATALAPGKTILYVLPPRTSAAGDTTLELTFSNGTTTGALPVLNESGSQIRARYERYVDGQYKEVGLFMLYDGTAWRILYGPKRRFARISYFNRVESGQVVFQPTGYAYEDGDEKLINVYLNGTKIPSPLVAIGKSNTNPPGLFVSMHQFNGDGSENTLEMILIK